MTTIIPERLALLDTITLDRGSHDAYTGRYCFNERAAWLAGKQHTDAPSCVSPVLRAYTMRLNDLWDDQQRQTLKPYLPRVIGTARDGKDPQRIVIAREALNNMLPPWLTLAGMGDEATSLQGLTEPGEIRGVLRRIRDTAWNKRCEAKNWIRAEVREQLAETPTADTVSRAVVAAAAATAANNATTVVAVAAAAAATPARAAAAVAAVIAVINAATTAAVADATADAVVAVEPVTRETALAYLAQSTEPAVAAVRQLGQRQHAAALNLLDRMIEAPCKPA